MGGDWALEILSFLGPKWHSSIDSMPFRRAQKTLDFQAEKADYEYDEGEEEEEGGNGNGIPTQGKRRRQTVSMMRERRKKKVLCREGFLFLPCNN